MLLEDDPYPRPETVRIWSTQLDVAYGDVNGWLEWKRSRERACTSSQPGTRVGTAPLPTPEQSASPEPKPALASTQDNSIPHSYPLTPTSPTFKPSAAQIPTEPTVKTEDDPISIRVASLLLDAVNASRQPIINSSNAPKNCAMFERLQRPFEDTISRLHRRLCKQENAP
ncbi:hypothetical protein CERSUDRAFT_85498 [Gelatoporia subvermispora B]|uniref:Uncharacterized protein n=1 Tax=Ceriporiopsis subvermispora (strain B) TaxID=914234 RepID=M2PHJ5_CERS8|nr:hypothetical protein CERSUDRAFT_85498 [Gelatoporia subvermispora B]